MNLSQDKFYKCKLNLESIENHRELLRFEFDSYPLVIVAVRIKTFHNPLSLQSTSDVKILNYCTFTQIGELFDQNQLEVKVVRQKLIFQNRCFTLFDVYGISTKKANEYDNEEVPSQAVLNSKQCVVCFTNPRDIVFIPCGHFAVCGSCLASMIDNEDLTVNLNNQVLPVKTCPICRAKIYQYSRALNQPENANKRF